MAVVCVRGLSSGVQADLMSQLLLPRDYGVKLCGREFIRAVIFTCGGSRWRRTTDGDLETPQWASQSEITEEDPQRTLPVVTELTDNHYPLQSSSSHSLADLLAIYSGLGERQPPHEQQFINEPNSLDPPQQLTLLGGQAGSPLVDIWPVSNRKKRHFSMGVAGMCCSQGCTKNDIGRLC